MGALSHYGGNRRALRAFAEREEMVRAGLPRRDLVPMGLIAGGGAGVPAGRSVPFLTEYQGGTRWNV
jgi:hypothetical protein